MAIHAGETLGSDVVRGKPCCKLIEEWPVFLSHFCLDIYHWYMAEAYSAPPNRLI